MKQFILFTCCLVLLLKQVSFSQDSIINNHKSVDFAPLIQRLTVHKWMTFNDAGAQSKSLYNPYFDIEISKNPIPLKVKRVLLNNPLNKTFPLSYSVIYKGKLVALFEPGIFCCFEIPSMNRDTVLESKLNTMSFSYHWMINNSLTGYSNGKNYVFKEDSGWVSNNSYVPL